MDDYRFVWFLYLYDLHHRIFNSFKEMETLQGENDTDAEKFDYEGKPLTAQALSGASGKQLLPST